MSRTKKNKPGAAARAAKADAADTAAASPVAVAEPAAPAASSDQAPTTTKRGKLIRPRGKRGGIKNRKGGPASKQADVQQSAVKGARKAKANGTSDAVEHTDSNAAPVPPAEHAEKIAKFHTLLKQLEQAKSAAEKDEIQSGLDSLGGLAQYQAWSLTGSAKAGQTPTSKWCMEALATVYQHDRNLPKFKVLDVGAITGTAYEKYRWVDATYIDLHPQGDNVQKYSFFDFPTPTAAEEQYNMVALSLVINFVGDVRKRGEMLRHVHKYLPTAEDTPGFCFLVLPLSCLTNSRYMNQTHLRAILDSLGFTVVKQSDSNKLSRWLLQRKPLAERKAAADKSENSAATSEWDGTIFKKRDINPGKDRNNFAIVVDPTP
ncbi:25S rRNA (adenine(2142)-N(1))-methyltransferase [Pseudozyma hubeiensis]|nr:25S rRNA (adenine(2142)-N(1))-methyltransferase [Pseudozyma hubeiensis]